MTTLDKLCIALFLLALAGIGAALFRQAYRRANPTRRPGSNPPAPEQAKPAPPKNPPPLGSLTRWQDGGRP